LETVYFICLVFGLGYAMIVGVIGPLFDIGHDGDFEHDVGHGDGQIDSHMGDLHVSPLSPNVLATFLVSFGGIGLIAVKGMGWGVFGSLLLASPSGVLVAVVFYYTVKALGSVTQASSEAQVSKLVGSEAAATIKIEVGGTGEIVYHALGTRYTAPARIDGEDGPVEKYEKVYITRIEGGIYYVRKMNEL